MATQGRAIDDLRHLGTVVETAVGPRLRPLEGLTVNRVWPTARRRLIGPFIFLDHMQPTVLAPGQGLDVPPHPHIGLATVTWLFEGELMHADSLGVRQAIRPGELNWMTAGRGITHAERTPATARASEGMIHGAQAWVALPAARERCEPDFEHVPADRLPLIEQGGTRLRVIAGEAFGERSPVATASRLFYVEARLAAGASIVLPPELGQRGVYTVAGRISIEGYDYAAGRLLVLADDRPCEIRADESSLLMLFGGEPLEGDRAIWWNFVASDPALIESARADWAADRFPAVPGDNERMSLPG